MTTFCPGYEKKKRLGEGGFGIVYLARRQSGKQVSSPANFFNSDIRRVSC